MDWTELGPWGDLISLDPAFFDRLGQQVEGAYATTTVYPPRQQLFAALTATPPGETRVVLLGQDPYHGPGQAHGLSFSVEPNVPIPKSLQNIYRELQSDLGLPKPETGCLRPWARQGVLLLNSVLTVEAGKAGSHRGFGWETLTDAIITATNGLPQPLVFLLWGSFAQKKQALIASEAPRLVLSAPHPSPLSAYRGFFGSRPFSQTNAFLAQHGQAEIRWEL